MEDVYANGQKVKVLRVLTENHFKNRNKKTQEHYQRILLTHSLP